ncbi:Putative transposase [Thiorhodovibrio frisius]|uniref:Putative transposase n=1 Tax=Thiorhodovibrio frisius TaxID=631362 RepID=H8Z4X0_9GAMM|nr:Putative transposase [Thiorhodovibrio frisius]WPL21119.1 hypothetical protein Thiofri_01227 [Thiorhodovibrio frisius]
MLERYAQISYLTGDGLEAGPMDQLIGHSITYRIAVGPQAGRKVFTLQTLPDSGKAFDDPVGQVSGFSLHAGVAAKARQRQKLERLCRYISAMTWSQRLKRVFGIDIETCAACAGVLRIIACIEDLAVIQKILTHIDSKNASAEPARFRRVGRHRRRVGSDRTYHQPTTRPTSPAPTRKGQARAALALTGRIRPNSPH